MAHSNLQIQEPTSVGVDHREQLELVMQHLALARRKCDAQRDSAGDQLAVTAWQERCRVLELVLEQTLAGYWDWHIQEETTYLSPSFKRMFGYAEHELPNTPETVDTLIFPDDLPGIKALYRQHVESNGTIPFSGELRVRHRDGSIIWVLCHGTVIEWDAQGHPLRMLGCHVDITERKRAEQARIETEERFRQVLENSQDAAYRRKLREPGYDYMSPVVERLLGYTPDELNAMTTEAMLELVHPDDRSAVIRLLADAAAHAGQTYQVEYRVCSKDDQYCWMSDCGQVIAGTDGRPQYMVGAIRDVTAHKQVEENLRVSYERLHGTLRSMINSLATAIEMRDPYTAGHQARVARLATAIAVEMELSKESVEVIQIAGLIHDIGKLGIPIELLNKPTKLTEIEFALIKTHADIGFAILNNIDFPWPIARIVHQHHERLDGSGYPLGLSGDQILREAQILCVADVVEAMSSHRPYRPALGIHKAIEEIGAHAGVWYDIEIVHACTALLRDKRFTLG